MKAAFRTNLKPHSAVTLHLGGLAKRTCLTVNAVINPSLIWRRWKSLRIAFVGTKLLIFFFFAFVVWLIFTSETCVCWSWQHLQSDQHRAFVLDFSNYTAVDQLVAEMLPGFDPNPPQQSEETLNRWVLIITLQCCELHVSCFFTVTQLVFCVW